MFYGTFWSHWLPHHHHQMLSNAYNDDKIMMISQTLAHSHPAMIHFSRTLLEQNQSDEKSTILWWSDFHIIIDPYHLLYLTFMCSSDGSNEVPTKWPQKSPQWIGHLLLQESCIDYYYSFVIIKGDGSSAEWFNYNDCYICTGWCELSHKSYGLSVCQFSILPRR